jgi:anti-anti-sigma factor
VSLDLATSTRTLNFGTQLTTLTLNGSLDSATAPELETQLAAIFEGATRILVLELAGLTFLSSAGLRVILAARQRVIGRSGSCVMLGMQPGIAKTFEIVKALDGLMLFKDDTELDTFLAALQRPPAA